MNGVHYIYGLCDPRTGDIRYVGQTMHHPRRRLFEHIRPSNLKPRTRKNGWIKSLLKIDTRPYLCALGRAEGKDEADEVERFWIEKLKDQGFDLTNGTMGGGGIIGHRHSEETKRKIGRANAGKERPQELRDRISKTKTGRKVIKSPEWIANQAASLRGKKHSDERRRNQSLAHMGIIQSEETKRKRKETWARKKLTS